jgi:hypothetical protein
VGALVKTATFLLEPSPKKKTDYVKAGLDVAACFYKPIAVGMAGLSFAGNAGRYVAARNLSVDLKRIDAPSWDARAHLASQMTKNDAAIREVRRLTTGYESLRRGAGAVP